MKIKKRPTKWEKILANHISDKELIPKVHYELISFNLILLKCPIETPGGRMASSLCTYQTEHISTPPDVFVFPTAILTAKTESVCVAYASPLARGMDGKRPGGTAPALTGSLYRFATRTCAVHSPVWLTASLHCSFRAPGDSPTHLAGPLWGGTAALRLSSWKVEESASTGGCMLDGVHQSPHGGVWKLGPRVSRASTRFLGRTSPEIPRDHASSVRNVLAVQQL